MNAPAPSNALPNRTRSRIKLLSIMAIFALPVVLAYAGYYGGWFRDWGRAAKGELIDGFPNLSDFGIARTRIESDEKLNGKWLLAYVHDDAVCNADCQRDVITIRQAWIATGKNQERVVPVVITPTAFELPDAVQALQAPVANGEWKSEARSLPAPAIYIIDPMGTVVLKYAAPKTEQDAIDRHKDIGKDFAKLLKFSRIG